MPGPRESTSVYWHPRIRAGLSPIMVTGSPHSPSFLHSISGQAVCRNQLLKAPRLPGIQLLIIFLSGSKALSLYPACPPNLRNCLAGTGRSQKHFNLPVQWLSFSGEQGTLPFGRHSVGSFTEGSLATTYAVLLQWNWSPPCCYASRVSCLQFTSGFCSADLG